MANETCILQIQGGLGKHLYLTAAVQVLKNNFPSRDVICVVAWPELFANLQGVKRVFPLGATQYFYDEYSSAATVNLDDLEFIDDPIVEDEMSSRDTKHMPLLHIMLPIILR
jgi:hypothetical protein